MQPRLAGEIGGVNEGYKTVLKQQNNNQKTPFFWAQTNANSGAIVISDTTRLGPYSRYLIDAYGKTNPDQRVQLNSGNSGTAVSLTGLGRSLTPSEIANGFEQVPVTREKIAIIVAADNPFQKSLTIQQVAQIFRGELTNWKDVGGVDAPIRIIGRPRENTARIALESYQALTGLSESQAGFPPQDSTAEIMSTLGRDGISFAPASEVIEQDLIRVVPIDNVSVDDARYPFSQPFTYVYQGDISTSTQAFLDFIRTPDAQAALEFAQIQPVDAARLAQSPIFPVVRPEDDRPSSPVPTSSPIAASPITEAPQSNPIGVETQQPTPWSWLPLVLLFVACSGLGWLVYMRTKLEEKKKKIPRPAPNYAERLKAQPRPETAIAVDPTQVGDSSELEVMDSSLSGGMVSNVAEAYSPSGNDPRWGNSPEDQTVLQAASSSVDEHIVKDDERPTTIDEDLDGDQSGDTILQVASSNPTDWHDSAPEGQAVPQGNPFGIDEDSSQALWPVAPDGSDPLHTASSETLEKTSSSSDPSAQAWDETLDPWDES